MTVFPPEYRQWAQGTEGVQRVQKVEAVPIVQRIHAARTEPLRISNPPDGATYLIDPTLRREFQTLSLKAVAALGPVQWTVNGRAIGTSHSTAGLEWSLVPGRHQIEARDARGRIAEASITVR